MENTTQDLNTDVDRYSPPVVEDLGAIRDVTATDCCDCLTPSTTGGY